ncbi:MAG: 1-deoxy-D-xylulose-5-phosphate synthase [Alphaproteobacteria bacterium]
MDTHFDQLNLNYEILDKIYNSCSIHDLSQDELKKLVTELRSKTIETVSSTGGHLGAGLGVVELTIALHHVFDTPKDKIIWDVGHQAYPHKIITDRKDRINTIRMPGGLSGFPKRSESVYDAFGVGHSSTSISAGLGMATARDLAGENYEVIAVIGDGAISAGMAYEAMNNAASSDTRLIVILNDNDMSIAKPVGAMSTYLSKLISSCPYTNLRNMAKQILGRFPKVEQVAKTAEKYAKNIASGGNLFEELGFYYIGPIDGHDISDLVKILRNVKDNKAIKKPILIHAVTEKGKGFHSKELCEEKFHAVSKFDLNTGIQQKIKTQAKTYTQVFGETLVKEAKQDSKIVAITAAMPSGTGLKLFAKEFPKRFFDVGIAEQHAVTFAAGLSCAGIKPFVAIYSTFLQRAYDQVIHDVAIQNLPVRFAIDRAGFVGADGPTHAGIFDITFLTTLPNFIVMAASDEQELANMVKTAISIDYAPSAFRYPRGEGRGIEVTGPMILPIGKGRIIQKGQKIAIMSLGTRLAEVIKASQLIKEEMGIDITIADMRFAKPIDHELIKELVLSHNILLAIEEGNIGGFSAQVLDYLTNNDLLTKDIKFRSLFLPDYFVEHNNQEAMYKEAKMDAESIKNLVLELS